MNLLFGLKSSRTRTILIANFPVSHNLPLKIEITRLQDIVCELSDEIRGDNRINDNYRLSFVDWTIHREIERSLAMNSVVPDIKLAFRSWLDTDGIR